MSSTNLQHRRHTISMLMIMISKQHVTVNTAGMGVGWSKDHGPYWLQWAQINWKAAGWADHSSTWLFQSMDGMKRWGDAEFWGQENGLHDWNMYLVSQDACQAWRDVRRVWLWPMEWPLGSCDIACFHILLYEVAWEELHDWHGGFLKWVGTPESSNIDQ